MLSKRSEVVRFTAIRVCVAFFLFFLFFLLSMVLFDFYIYGDQVHYRKFYDVASSASYFEAYFFARDIIGASEPVSIFILWLGSWLGFEKDLYVSFINSIFVVLLWLTLCLYRVRFYIIVILFLNFYLFVLLTGAERLKFGYFFIFLSLISSGWLRFAFGAFSVLAHFQMMLLFPSFVALKIYDRLSLSKFSFVVKKTSIVYSLISILVLVFFFVFFFDTLYRKFSSYYSGSLEILPLVNVLVLTIVALGATSNWKRMLISISPFYFFVMILGGERVNVLAVSFVIWLLMSEGRLSHPLSLSLLLYFALKMFSFVYNIYAYGNGFP